MSDVVQGGTVTFLFTDLVGSTRLIDALGDDESDPLIRQHLRRLRAVVSRHEGKVVKSLGDGLMAAFTSAAHAVDAAVHMQQAVAASDDDHELGLRIGINSGEAVYDGIDYYGKPVWVAQRYCDAAEGGQILTSDVVRTLVGTRGSHRFEDRGVVQLRGVSEPALALEVMWEPDPNVDLAALDARSSSRSSPGRIVVVAGIAAATAVALLWFVLSRPDGPPLIPAGNDQPVRAPISAPEPVSVKLSDGGLGESTAGEPSVANGGAVAFATAAKLVKQDTNQLADVYLFADGEPRLVSTAAGAPGDSGSFKPRISSDGGSVVFLSRATNLVPGVTDGLVHVYLYDVEDGALQVVSRRNNGRLALDHSRDPAISANGRYVAFASRAGNLAVFGDRNDDWDVFRHDLSQDTTLRRSVPAGEADTNGPSVDSAISPDGTVGFSSRATNLVPGDGPAEDVFFYSRANRPIEVSAASEGEADGRSHSPSLATAASAVAFVSGATNLVGDDANGVEDVFVWTRDGVEIVSVSTSEEQADGASSAPVISSDGRFVAFLSDASNLVPGDENDATDAFLRDLERGTTERLSLTVEEEEIEAPTVALSLSGNARYFAFVARAEAVDPNLASDVETVFLSEIGRATRIP